MTAQTLPLTFVASLVALLVWVIISDLQTRTIPNWTNGLIAALGIGYWVALWMTQSVPLWPGLGFQVLIALAAFALFLIFFALNAMGGGDVKLIAALGLWFPVVPMVRVLLIMSILGGALTLIVWARHKFSLSGSKIEVPYGVAIAMAAIWVLYERNLNHFG
jgi:prepilin peptidase CpaA